MRQQDFLSLGPHEFHRVAWTEWGEPDNPRVLVCVHGLTRSGRDFDALARALERDYRVVCPDMAGRGRSQWLAHKADYGYPLYCADVAALLARLHAETVDWVGTSMGGLIGLLLAATPGTPIRRLVLNDVGPLLPKAALERIVSYVGTDPGFDSVADLERHLREIHAPFGDLSDEQWAHLAAHSARRLDDGRVALHYDPGIAQPLRSMPIEDQDLWSAWDAIRCPTLVLRGAQSDLLLPDTAAQMQQRGPRARLVEIEGVGHAPMLMDGGQIATVRDWLGSD